MEQLSLEKLQSQIVALQEQMNALQKFVQEDMEFARRTEEAWQEIEEGKGIKVKLEDLDKVMDSWKDD